MCGISLSVTSHSDKNCSCFNQQPITSKLENRLNLLKNRGPDGFLNQIFNFNGFQIETMASVLHQRGQTTDPTLQPVVSPQNDFLLWNGEIFNGETVGLKENENDTLFLLNKFSELEYNKDTRPNILDILSHINGPWAFAFWHNQSHSLWFGRDIFGRRSLLWPNVNESINKDACFSWGISSVDINGKDWLEVPTNGVYCLDMSNFERDTFNFSHALKCFSWSFTPSGVQTELSKKETSIFKLITPIKNILNTKAPPTKMTTQTISDYIKELYNMKNILDINSLKENSSDFPDVLETLSKNPLFSVVIDQFGTILGESVAKRIQNHPMLCKNCILNHSEVCRHASLAVLFSGGIDSMVIAYLADKYLPGHQPIDLLNVSFENSKKGKNPTSRKDEALKMNVFSSPDRKTGIQGYEELSRVCPTRVWNFVEIDITTVELQEKRESRIKYLIKPSNTVLDDSIGCAIWFASRGNGVIRNLKGVREVVDYSSPARVVLVGMGADEQLGGYSRHRQKYVCGGFEGLLSEIRLEIDRISTRNLGRDDRIISDHGIEARFPFLDEFVVNFLNQVPLYLKTNLELPRGLGDKILIRLTAHVFKLTQASILPKRAIQFGSRIAFSEGKEKGSDTCKRL